MKQIELTNGMKTIVDDDTYEWAKKYKWTASISKKHNKIYAIRNTRDVERKRTVSKSLHREILGLEGRLEFTDHINGNPLDNRKDNLRVCTPGQNAMNRPSNKGKSIYKGVCLRGKSWEANIKHNGKMNYLGHFKTEEQAAAAYDGAASVLFKEFALFNLRTNYVKMRVKT